MLTPSQVGEFTINMSTASKPKPFSPNRPVVTFERPVGLPPPAVPIPPVMAHGIELSNYYLAQLPESQKNNPQERLKVVLNAFKEANQVYHPGRPFPNVDSEEFQSSLMAYLSDFRP
jgi:hypothetical protein